LRGRQRHDGLRIRRYESRDQKVVWQLHALGLKQMGANLGHGPWDDDIRDVEHAYLADGDSWSETSTAKLSRWER
jgi:hypothetical protein